MAERAYKYILFSVEGGVATITLNRPERLNAFHFGLGAELEQAYARCDEEDVVLMLAYPFDARLALALCLPS